jgi:hypothetical protein
MTLADFSVPVANPLAAGLAPAVTAAATSTNGEGGITFHDLLDIVNPLQHIPVVDTLYRAITGDHIKTFPKIAGDLLFGGVTGFVSSIADTVFQKITGKSVGDTVLDFAENLVSPTPAAGGPAAPATASISAPVGESLGDKILDWVEHVFSHSDAAATPAPATAATVMPSAAVPAPTPPATLQAPASDGSGAIVVPGQDALMLALTRNGIGQDVAMRAADAYRRTLSGAATAPAGTLH